MSDISPFFKLFEQLSKKSDFARVFDDFITISLTQFAFPDCEIGKQWHAQAVSNYDSEQRKIISEMFFIMLKTYKSKLSDEQSWFDFFGDLYMEISGKWKSSAFGQFFTPEPICELMTRLTMPKGTGKRINDPACGSGRLLISHHVKNLGNYYVGEDLDLICCKMATLNFLLHGCVGEIIHHDSLTEPDKFRHKFIINPLLNSTLPIPHVIIELDGVIPFEKIKPISDSKEPIKIETKINQNHQFSLF